MSRGSRRQRTPEEEDVLEELRKTVVGALGHQRARVYLFGSWASGTQRRASDIDLAIEAPAPLPAATLARVREAIEESHIPYRVDVVDLAEVDASFRARALREGQVWIELASD
jgi:predicted nucleotidyltransferase